MLFLTVPVVASSLQKTGYEDFDGEENELSDWTQYHSYPSERQASEQRWYVEDGRIKHCAWGWMQRNALLYQPKDWSSPEEGWFEAKVTFQNTVQEAGIVAKASGEGQEVLSAIFFLIDGRDGSVLLRSGEAWNDFGAGSVGNLEDFAKGNTYLMRLYFKSTAHLTEYYGEI